MTAVPDRISEADRDRLIEAAAHAICDDNCDIADYSTPGCDWDFAKADASLAVDAVLSELGIHVTQKEQQ